MINTKDFNMKKLKPSDVTDSYVNWMKDKKVTLFSENQYKIFSLEGKKKYVNKIINLDNQFLYGIFHKDIHIGNINIGPINFYHKNAEITYMIGNKTFWGMGLGSWAVENAVKIAKNDLKLIKVYAGCSSKNTGSRKVLEKNGFHLEGVRKKHLFLNGEWQDQCDYGLILI